MDCASRFSLYASLLSVSLGCSLALDPDRHRAGGDAGTGVNGRAGSGAGVAAGAVAVAGTSGGTVAGDGSLEIGQMCSAPRQCKSENCVNDQLGQPRCHGTAQANEVCQEHFDCEAGSCMASTIEELMSQDGTRRCVPAAVVCRDQAVPSGCVTFANVLCVRARECAGVAEDEFDLDACVEDECDDLSAAGLNDALCVFNQAGLLTGVVGCAELAQFYPQFF